MFLVSKGEAITATIALDADDEILVERLLERGKTSVDQMIKTKKKIRNRYQEYNEKTAPLIDFIKTKINTML